MRILKKMLKIIKLRFKSSLNDSTEDWVKERREICGACPLNSKNIPIKDRGIRWYKWKNLNMGKDFCTVCGCGIKAMTLDEVGECSDKTNKRWKSII